MIRIYLSILFILSIISLPFVAMGLPWVYYSVCIGLFAVGAPFVCVGLWLIDKACNALHLP